MAFLTGLLNVLIVILSLFLICLVLIQRGKGGGLAGAFGGAGGSSAFGTKAGDVFTRVTIITAGIWIGMAMLLVVTTAQTTRQSAYDITPAGSATTDPLGLPETGTPATTPSGTQNTAPSGTASSPALSPAGTPPPIGEPLPEVPSIPSPDGDPAPKS